MNITKGKINRGQKVVIYGVEGIGKSTLASNFPEALFIDTEGSTGNMDVSRLDKPTSFTMLMNEIAFVKANLDVCKTLVIDTVDWAERLASESICANYDKKDITEFGYGEGFLKLETEMGRFLNSLSDLTEKGINVVLTAHAIIRKFEQPDEMGAYDRYELKLGNKTTAKTASLIKEWADMVLFCNYKTHVFAVDDKGKKHKAQGGTRTMYAEHHPAWDAKNRHGLPFEMPMVYESIAHIFKNNAQPLKQNDVKQVAADSEPEPIFNFSAENIKVDIDEHLPNEVQDLMRLNNVSTSDLVEFWTSAGHFPANMPIANIPDNYWGMLVANFDKVIFKK